MTVDAITRAAVLDVLKSITNPATGTDLVASDVIRALTVADGRIRFVIEVPPEEADRMEAVRSKAVAALEGLAGAGNVSALLTAHTERKPPDLKPGRVAPQGPQPFPGVKSVIAIGSGKGGVGKSTVSANLAVALAAAGKKVGLLDADVYGPSQPRMLGVSGRPASPDGKTILPLRNHGVTLMSIGLLTREDEAVVWRGPMLMGALQQMLGQVQWGNLDVLLVDLPPGTGDVQLTLSQKTRLAGAIVVSTPQDVALLDARKALDMFAKTGVAVLGMIENMSAFVCPGCGLETHVFGHGGARAEAARQGIPLLGEIPLDLDIRLASDGGAPIVAAKPESPQAAAFRAIAQRLIDDGHV
ncbi:MAG: Mrp/NBP35 family ATP-binding protein [Rhodobacteraceae bacterium]|nr:Mrp/NBP35 family ATP-binding protein [Paracoccaceae bacterium]